MPSSQFSSPKKFYKRPAVCRKSPPGFPAAWNSFYPPTLTVNFRVADYDPPIDFNFFGEFQILRPAHNFTYEGKSDGTTEYVSCRAFPIGTLGIWSFAFTIVAPHVPGETHIYSPTIPKKLHAFDSQNIGEVNVPKDDFRYFRIHG